MRAVKTELLSLSRVRARIEFFSWLIKQSRKSFKESRATRLKKEMGHLSNRAIAQGTMTLVIALLMAAGIAPEMTSLVLLTRVSCGCSF